MLSKYDPTELAKDATAFASSNFGKHYLERLASTRERHLKDAMNSNYNDSFRAHAATKAAAVQDEIDYFDTAKKIRNSPDLIARLTSKFKKEESPDV